MFNTILNYLLTHFVPAPLKQEVKFSTIIHISILLFFIISSLIVVPRYKYSRPTIHNVQLVNLANLRPQQSSGLPSLPSTPKPVEQKPEMKTEPVQKTKTEQKAEIKTETKPITSVKKATMTIPTKEEKMKNVKTLEDRLMEKFKEIDKNNPPSKRKWQEPSKQNQAEAQVQSASIGTGLSVSADGFDSSNFPFAFYLDQIQSKITSCWNEPQMALAKQYTTVVSFTINKTGEIKDVRVKRSSGVPEFDQSGLKAVELAKPFPQLPPGYNYQELVVNVEFKLQ